MVAVSVFQNLQPHSMFVRRADARLARGYALRTPGEVLQALDREYPFERFANFFTMVYLILDLSKHTLFYSNAGHPHPVLVRQGGELELLKRGGPFIGLRSVRSEDEKEKPFIEEEVRFDPGDKLLIYTDGLTEYHDPTGTLFGRDRLMDILRRRGQNPVSVLIDSVCTALESFGDGRPPEDDVTLLGIELK
jgi:sigma-B regulation protein RsbU (phosphoserine phosphatase)